MNNLVKSFEVGKNVLDGLTFQGDQGERVGLLGRNGAGKTTLFKILTGELDYDEGTVVVGQGRRVGLISQIPVYPAGCTVEDVLRSAFARLESLEEVTEAYYTTGHYSIFIKVMCKSIDALQQVLINKIQTIDEIQSTETLIVLQNPIMRTIKP